MGCEILQVVNCLLYSVHSKAFDAKIRIRVAETVKAMLKQDDAAILLFRYRNPL